MVEYIKQSMLENYNLHINSIEQTAGGWTADAYIAKTGMAEYFVKVYDKCRPSTHPWIERMEMYMPVVHWLYEKTKIHNWMNVPLLTIRGEYKAEDERHILLVFPLLKGITIGDAVINTDQIRQLAAILAELHAYGSKIPVSTDAIKEDYSLPFLQSIIDYMEAREKPLYLQNTLHPYETNLKKAIEVLQELSASLQKNNFHYVLCHTDIHGGNLMLTNKIVLIDWEGIRLAPAEADLFTFTDGFFFDYAYDEFMSVYQSIRKDYVINEDAMLFYRLRRRMEDVSEFVHSLGHDGLSPEKTATTIQFVQKECTALANMLYH